MTALRRVPNEVTEDALRLLSVTFADLTRSATFASWGRHLRLSPRSTKAYDHVAVRRESCYLRLISIVEAYVDVVASERLRADFDGATPLLRLLIEDAERSTSRGWPERERSFERHHKTPLKKVPGYVKVSAGTDVRNAIAHGVGQLTPRQRTQTTRRRIEGINVSVRDNYIVLTHESLSTCLSFCRGFVIELDRRLA